MSKSKSEYGSVGRTPEMTTYGALGVLEEDFGRVGDALLLLGRSAGAVDARCGLGRVPAHEPGVTRPVIISRRMSASQLKAYTPVLVE